MNNNDDDTKIPIRWILDKNIDPLLNITKDMEPSPFRDAVLLRIEHYMDLIQSWQKRHEDRNV